MLGAGLAAFVAFPAVEARLAAGMAGEPAVDAPVLVLSEVRMLVLGFASVIGSVSDSRKRVIGNLLISKGLSVRVAQQLVRCILGGRTSIDDGRPSRRNGGLKVGVRW